MRPAMKQQRRKFQQTSSLEQRLAQESERLREQARKLPHGPEREILLRKARQAKTDSRMSEWLRSPGLKPV